MHRAFNVGWRESRAQWVWSHLWRYLLYKIGIATLVGDRLVHYYNRAPLKRGLWGWWSWWGFSCNHLPHLVVMATQPEARALGRRGGSKEREGGRGRDAGKHGPQCGCLVSFSMHQLTRPGIKKKNKKNVHSTVNQSVTFTSLLSLLICLQKTLW